MKHLINLVNRTEIEREIELLIFRNRQFQKCFVSIGRWEDFVNQIEE